jgi:hypothetical protein
MTLIKSAAIYPFEGCCEIEANSISENGAIIPLFEVSLNIERSLFLETSL